MENPFNTQENKPKRSNLLIVLLVLTVLNNGCSFYQSVKNALHTEAVIETLQTSLETLEGIEDEANGASMGDLLSGSVATVEQTIAIVESYGPLYYIIVAVLAAMSLLGAFFMYRLNKLGFHLYASSQVLGLLLPFAFGMTNFSSTLLFVSNILGILFTALFIWLYARELKIGKNEEYVSK